MGFPTATFVFYPSVLHNLLLEALRPEVKAGPGARQLHDDFGFSSGMCSNHILAAISSIYGKGNDTCVDVFKAFQVLSLIAER